MAWQKWQWFVATLQKPPQQQQAQEQEREPEQEEEEMEKKVVETRTQGVNARWRARRRGDKEFKDVWVFCTARVKRGWKLSLSLSLPQLLRAHEYG